jgi:hypothetical protein
MYWQKIKNFFGNLFSRKQGKWGVVPAFPGHR